jgi:hypothetical protein
LPETVTVAAEVVDHEVVVVAVAAASVVVVTEASVVVVMVASETVVETATEAVAASVEIVADRAVAVPTRLRTTYLLATFET